VDNGDGSYHYALPSGASTATHWDGMVQWEYVGQANYSWVRVPHVSVTLTADPWVEPGGFGLADIVGTRRVDGSAGESGAPGYYYPGGCCSGGNWVHGVYGGHLINRSWWTGAVNWRGSAFARVRPVRRWIMATM